MIGSYSENNCTKFSYQLISPMSDSYALHGVNPNNLNFAKNVSGTYRTGLP